MRWAKLANVKESRAARFHEGTFRPSGVPEGECVYEVVRIGSVAYLYSAYGVACA